MPIGGASGKDVLDGRDNHHKVRLFRRFFSGLRHVYGTYDPGTGRSWQVKAEVTDQVILEHLTGRRSYGVYLLTDDADRTIHMTENKAYKGVFYTTPERAVKTLSKMYQYHNFLSAGA